MDNISSINLRKCKRSTVVFINYKGICPHIRPDKIQHIHCKRIHIFPAIIEVDPITCGSNVITLKSMGVDDMVRSLLGVRL